MKHVPRVMLVRHDVQCEYSSRDHRSNRIKNKFDE